MPRDHDEQALVLFARELQAARTRAGMSRELLASQINYSPSLIGMVESCRRVPGLDFAQRCDKALGTTGTLERLQEFLRTAPFPAWFRPFVEYEARATSLRGFEHVLVPGLLQTPEYARAVLANRPNTSEDQVEELVTARMERQVILDRTSRPCCGWCWTRRRCAGRSAPARSCTANSCMWPRCPGGPTSPSR